MRTLLILVALAMLTVGIVGCGSTAGYSVGRNMNYLGDDVQRQLGLDQPSPLHARDNIAPDALETYRPYD